MWQYMKFYFGGEGVQEGLSFLYPSPKEAEGYRKEQRYIRVEKNSKAFFNIRSKEFANCQSNAWVNK